MCGSSPNTCKAPGLLQVCEEKDIRTAARADGVPRRMTKHIRTPGSYGCKRFEDQHCRCPYTPFYLNNILHYRNFRNQKVTQTIKICVLPIDFFCFSFSFAVSSPFSIKGMMTYQVITLPKHLMLVVCYVGNDFVTN